MPRGRSWDAACFALQPIPSNRRFHGDNSTRYKTTPSIQASRFAIEGYVVQPKRSAKGNAVASWTGGKDGCYSCYAAMQDGYNVTHLLNFRNVKKVGSHEINPELIQAQSEAIGIPLIQRDFTSYEQEFKKVVSELRAGGARVDAAVFGHIQTHKMLVDRICQDLNIDQLLPIWNRDSDKVLTEILDLGFEVFVVSVRDGLLGKEWLGRRIDDTFITDLRKTDKSIDPCGENGEFHTLVTDGPIFKRKIMIGKSEPILREGYWFLNIGEYAVREK